MPELLAKASTFAVRAIPGADGAGVTLLRLDDLAPGGALAGAPSEEELNASHGGTRYFCIAP